jgi:hypothetical protein
VIFGFVAIVALVVAITMIHAMKVPVFLTKVVVVSFKMATLM